MKERNHWDNSDIKTEKSTDRAEEKQDDSSNQKWKRNDWERPVVERKKRKESTSRANTNFEKQWPKDKIIQIIKIWKKRLEVVGTERKKRKKERTDRENKMKRDDRKTRSIK